MQNRRVYLCRAIKVGLPPIHFNDRNLFKIVINLALGKTNVAVAAAKEIQKDRRAFFFASLFANSQMGGRRRAQGIQRNGSRCDRRRHQLCRQGFPNK